MCWKSIGLTTVGISLGIASVLCGDGIKSSANLSQMIGFSVMSVVLLVAALLLIAFANLIEQNEYEAQNKKIKRVPTHSNEWRGECE